MIQIPNYSDLSMLVFQNEYLPSAFAPDILEANGRSIEERLASCKMIVSPEDTTPTVLGVLTLANNPQDFLPGAYIQFLRIDGLELTDDVSDEQTIGGTLVDMLRQATSKLKSHNRTHINVLTGSTHQVESWYPINAILQALYNAILHRTYEGTNAPVRVTWYNDRIEIQNPGGPYGNVTIENFGNPGITDYRNPNLRDALKIFGFIQAFGRGIPLIKREMEKNGNPAPEFTPTEHAVLITLRQGHGRRWV